MPGADRTNQESSQASHPFMLISPSDRLGRGHLQGFIAMDTAAPDTLPPEQVNQVEGLRHLGISCMWLHDLQLHHYLQEQPAG